MLNETQKSRNGYRLKNEYIDLVLFLKFPQHGDLHTVFFSC